MKKLNVQINEIIDAYKFIRTKIFVKISEFLSKYTKDILTALTRLNWVYTGQLSTYDCVPILSANQTEDCISAKYPPINDKTLQMYTNWMKRINDVTTFNEFCKNKDVEECKDKLYELVDDYLVDLETDEKGNITKIIPRWCTYDDENNAESNANSNSENYTNNISNKRAVPQIAVPQPIINSAYTNLSLGHVSDASNESHSNNLWHRDKILNLLKQNRELREQVEILDLLERIKKEGLVGNDEIKFRVSASFKELYSKYYAPKKPTLSPKTQVIREAILRIILDDLILSGKIDTESLRQFGFEIPDLDEVKKAERIVYMPIIQKEAKEEEKPKEELKRDEFKQKFNEFEKFLNELIFTQDNLINNAYLVTKPLAKKLFQYIEELANMDNTPPEAKKLLIEMKDYLIKYPLSEKRFANGIASIPTGVYKQEITVRLTKIEKLLN